MPGPRAESAPCSQRPTWRGDNRQDRGQQRSSERHRGALAMPREDAGAEREGWSLCGTLNRAPLRQYLRREVRWLQPAACRRRGTEWTGSALILMHSQWHLRIDGGGQTGWRVRETGRRAGRREPDGGSACSPLPPGCKAKWRLTAVRHPRTGFKVTTQISLHSGRWEECQSVTGQAGGKRGGRWVTDGWAVGGGTEGPSRGNPNPV